MDKETLKEVVNLLNAHSERMLNLAKLEQLTAQIENRPLSKDLYDKISNMGNELKAHAEIINSHIEPNNENVNKDKICWS